MERPIFWRLIHFTKYQCLKQLRDSQAILCYLARKYDSSAQYLADEPAAFGQIIMRLAFAGNELITASAARLHDVLGYALNVESARA